LAKKDRPTVRDVAREAGVSIATVSRALSRPDDVNEKTRSKVRAVVERTGYRANRAAVEFRRGGSHTLLVLVSDITNAFFAEFFKGIEEEARSAGYVVLIGDTSENADNERVYSDMLLTRQAGGLILNTYGIPEDLLPERGGGPYTGPPVVSCSGHKEIDLPCVLIDDALGGRLAGEHLVGLGHRDIAQVCGPLQVHGFERRYFGFCHALKSAGLPLAPMRNLIGEPGTAYGEETARVLMRMDPMPTAVFVHNDETAVGLMHGLKKLNVRVPEDISVVGYDDMPYASVFNPELTTLHLPRRRWGRLACRMLISILDPEANVETSVIIPPELIVRRSTARRVSE